MNLLQAIILAIVEGLTEFLPVSSTGHMIIASTAMGISSNPFVKVFTVAIQLGAILSVVVLYWKHFFKSWTFYLRLFVAFVPAVVFGLLLKDYIDLLLGNILVVAFTLIAGGIVFLFLDNYFDKQSKRDSSIDDLTLPKAFRIGLFQVVSMAPGVSRSAATIIGGLTQGLNPKTAAEFSFFLAVPTMFAATVYSLYDFLSEESTVFTSNDLWILAVGNLVAFVVAMLAIRSFIQFLTKNGFRLFGYYRIAVGLIILVLWAMGKLDRVNLDDF